MNAHTLGAATASHDFGPGVRLEPYGPGRGLPMFIHAEDPALAGEVDAAVAWVHAMKERIDDLATDVGAVVLRGFATRDTEAFARAVEPYPNPEFGYDAGASPRSVVHGRIYEATRTPAEVRVPLHQEMAYLPHWPDRIAFFCRVPAETGGETLIADVRRFETLLPASLRQSVEQRGVRYLRNFRSPDWSTGDPPFDVVHRSWTEAFSTDDPAVAEASCRAMGVEFEWSSNDSLSVITNTPGVAVHPRTGQTIWFNQAATLTMNDLTWGASRMAAIERYYPAGVTRPYEVTFADGGPMTLDELRPVYDLAPQVEVAFPWAAGDILFLDNYHTFHGRSPYTGHRDVQVALLA